MINNSIYLRRKKKVNIDIKYRQSDVSNNKIQIIGTILKNIECLGYTLEPKLIETLLYLNLTDIVLFYEMLRSDLKKLVGDHVKWEPFYPNFPKQVMELDEVELYLNALLHYLGDWIGLRILPHFVKEERFPLQFNKDLKIISLGDQKDFDKIFYNLLSSKTSLSSTDYEDLNWYLINNHSIDTILPEKIHHKEILAYLTNRLIDLNRINDLKRFFTTATDVLRLATAMSNGDISLSTNTRFKKFSRPERRLILGLLENCKNIKDDMFKHKKKWIRLGEILHPGDYNYKYPNCSVGFFLIRNKEAYHLTYNAKVEKYLIENNLDEVIDLLKTKPGEFARRLDHLLRSFKHKWLKLNFDSEYKIINAFQKISNQISPPVLLQLIAHLNNRNEEKELRIFFPKGNVAKSYSIENELPHINKLFLQEIGYICRIALIERFKKLDDLGKVYIDPKLVDYVVPLGQRSASKSLLTLSRFSKIEFSEDPILRFFLWWRDMDNDEYDDRVDIDLSAVMYDNEWKYLEHVSYTNLRSDTYNIVHSGDITSAPEGACEFLDVDIDSVIKYGGRYIVISLNSFTQQPFNELPECFAGWMSRNSSQSGEIFEPRTVENKVDLTANTKICIPVIIDLKEKKIIWTDLALSKEPLWNNVEMNQRGMVLMGKGITLLHKPNLYELFSLHAQARGIIVDNMEEADTIFSLTEGITPFDIDVINSEFL